ncbi:MAG: 5'-nucleotidase [Pseudomonadota bacterium]
MNKTLCIAISSRALFDLEEGHKIYINQGIEAYCKYQLEHENEFLQPGIGFSLVKKLLSLNEEGADQNREYEHSSAPRVEVILLSRNNSDTGLRIFNSIEHHKLNIVRAAFSGGETPLRYVQAFGTDLFLSADPKDVTEALEQGFAAATLLPSVSINQNNSQLRIAFDGDAVLFSDESERVFSKGGLDAFDKYEKDSADTPLSAGPFKEFLSMLHQLQSHFSESSFPQGKSPIRTALVTSRGAPAHERVIKTLRQWGIRIDETLFLGGMPKGEFLKAFGADIFFDDQTKHCDAAANFVSTAHVPHGIKNK